MRSCSWRRAAPTEIAEKLFISVKTVQNHVQNILSKLQLKKRYELMRYALQRGLDGTPDWTPGTIPALESESPL